MIILYVYIYIVVDMYGLSDHDLMFTKEDEELDGDENVEYIEERSVVCKIKCQTILCGC